MKGPRWFGATAGSFRRLGANDSGSVVVMTTLMFLVLLGLASLAIDLGITYWDRREVQNAADGAALAGASHLPNDPTTAQSVAQTYATDNGTSGADTVQTLVTTTFNANDTLVVTTTRTLNQGANGTFDLGLRYFIGGGPVSIRTAATAIVAPVQPGNIVPWAISENQVTVSGGAAQCTSDYVECALKLGSGSGPSGGNVHALDWGSIDPSWPNGDAGYTQALATGYTGPIPAPVSLSPPTWNFTMNTEPGNQGSHTLNALDQYWGWDAAEQCNGGTASCAALYRNPASDPSVPNGTDFFPQAQTSPKVCYTDVRCPRVVVVPFIADTWTALHGRAAVTVVNFGCFYVTQYSGNPGHTDVDGMFLPHCDNLNMAANYGGSLSGSGLTGSSTTVFLWQ